ncbi:MAG: ABC transporter permease, partial [Alphaproteobacteria bacterium]
MLRLAPAATILLFVGPVAIGLAGVILPSFGYLPALGGDSISLQPWRRMLAEPGLLTAARLSLTTGFAATALSLVIALGFVAACHGTRMYGRVRHMLARLLAVPHAAVAIGLAFLIAPSGWASRLASPWATGWQTPPDALIIHDTLGLSLVAGLVVKEVPFLLLAIMAALNQLPVERSLATARTMGYGAVAAWGKAILPLIYRQIRLPVYAVLAFSMSVVDMAIILGPTTPGPLAREIMRLFNDPDLSQRFVAAAAAVSQVLLVLAAIAVWRLGELCAGRALRVWLSDGRRHVQDRAIRWPVTIALSLLLTVAAASFLAMALWSVAGVWRFPDGMPDTWSLSTWHRLAAPLSLPMTVTITTAVASTVLALSLVLACLESEYRRGLRPGAHVLWLVYVPLLVPQIAFLFGNQIFLVALGLDGRWLALIWAHLLFVLPYV